MSAKKEKFTIKRASPKAAADKGFELQIHTESGEPTPLFITVTGQEGTAYQAKWNELQNERLRKEFELERKGQEGAAVTIEDVVSKAAALLAACTTGWRTGDQPIVPMDEDEDLEFNEANAIRLYTEEKWIRMQVEAAVSDMGNFMPS